MLALVERAAVNRYGKARRGMSHRETHDIAGHRLAIDGENHTQEVGVARLQQFVGNHQFARRRSAPEDECREGVIAGHLERRRFAAAAGVPGRRHGNNQVLAAVGRRNH